MQKNKVTKQKIFDAAKVIAHMNKEPTIANVREYLAFTGSQTTLQKYLEEWKLKCFQMYEPNYVKSVEQMDFAGLQVKNQELTVTIEKMEDHNKIVSAEFAKTERKNIELTQNLTKLEDKLALLEKEFDDLKKNKEHLDNLYSGLKEEREILLSKMEKDKDQLIASLREELRQTNQTSMEKIQNVGYQGHELLMQEKVKTINLEEKVKFLTKEQARLQKELDNAYSGPNRSVIPVQTD